MEKKFHRSPNLKANKYQRNIILLSFLPTILFLLMTTLFVVLFFHELVQVTLYQSRANMIEMIIQWRGHFLTIFAAFLIGHLVFSFILSSNLVGAFERIIRELDLVLKGEKKTPITSRPNDILAKELLVRVNKLIEKYHP